MNADVPRFLPLLAALALAACCESAPPDPARDPGPPDAAAALSLLDLDGVSREPTVCGEGDKAACVIFTTTDCPIANGYAPEIAAIAKEYAPRGIRFTLAQVDPDLTAEVARAHAKEYSLESVAQVFDRRHELADFAGATITPEAAVYLPGGDLAYRGRIDDQFAELGVRRAEPSERDLRAALDAILAGQPVPTPRTDAVGCLLPLPLEE